MNLAGGNDEHLPPPPPFPRPPADSCSLHPDEVVTGFCASCLRDRLTALEPSLTNNNISSDSARRKSTSSTVKSLFSRTAAAAAAAAGGAVNSSSSSATAELRRCKSFSAARADPLSLISFEPQRRSCDVRGRSTLYSLFYLQDRQENPDLSSSTAAAGAPVLPQRKEEDTNDLEEIRPVAEPATVPAKEEQINSTTVEIAEAEEAKPMKEHIDIEAQNNAKPPPPPQRDFKEIAGSFWMAASVFSKKLQKWRRKQKLKKQQQQANCKSNAAAGMRQAEKQNQQRRFYQDTQSEIGVDASGRRSCDIAPRFSLDASRMSFDEPRFSRDKPRASWDGYLIGGGGGGRSALPRLPPILSVVEDDPCPIVQRSDGHIPVEEDAMIPGGTAQTRDYYLDSSSQRRRRSLDRSSSTRKAVLEMNEPKPAANAKVSPAASSEFFNPFVGSILEREPMDLNSNSIRDDRSESFESIYRDSQNAINSSKKPKRRSKGWNIWGFMHWRSSGGGGRGVERANVVDRSFSESWSEIRRNGINGKMLRSNSNASSRHSFSSNSGLGSMRRSNIEMNGHGKKRREEFVFERNRSARYSPNHLDNGLHRFYLAPMRGSRRNGATLKNSYQSSESFARTMLRMY